MRTLTLEQPLFWRWGDQSHSASSAWLDHLPDHDRSFQFGDGLFETMRTNADGELPLWRLHRQRLQEGFVRLDFPASALAQVEACWQHLALPPNSGIKLIVSRGSSQQGYAPAPKSDSVTLRWSAFVAPDWKHRLKPNVLVLGLNPVRLARQPQLAGLKHTNRLEQVLARKAFEPGWDESIMLDTQGQVVEGTMSNVLWLTPAGAWTPRVDQAGVNGVMRRWLLEQSAITEADCTMRSLAEAEAVVLMNSITGLIPVYQLEQFLYDRHNPLLQSVMAYQHRLEALFGH